MFCQPVAQVHVNMASPSMQVAPLRQGLDRHSLISWSQKAPVKPGLQLHLNALTKSVQLSAPTE